MPRRRGQPPSGGLIDTRFSSFVAQPHISEAPREVPASVQAQLERLQREREELEDRVARAEGAVYHHETEYLRQCVELGGSLFDGLGLERRAETLQATTRVYQYGADMAAVAATQVSKELSESGDADGGPPLPEPLVLPLVTSAVHTERDSLYTRAHSFSPSERVFSGSAVGTLARVQRYLASGGGGGGGQKPGASDGDSSDDDEDDDRGEGSSSALTALLRRPRGSYTTGGYRMLTRRQANLGRTGAEDEDEDDGDREDRRNAYKRRRLDLP